MENENFGSVLGSLTKPYALPPLNAGFPNKSVYDDLYGLSVKTAFENKPVEDESMGQCCIAGLWLLHGYLDQSHRISQQVGSPTGSYWHGIMHRREGDYGNSKYWFRQTGDHQVWEQLVCDTGRCVDEVGNSGVLPESLINFVWDPYRFVDLCEEFSGTASEAEQCLRKIQMREWELLFVYSYQKAVGI